MKDLKRPTPLCHGIAVCYCNTMHKKELAKIPSLSDFSSRKEWEDACWKKIAGSEELLSLLVTAHESHDIVMRAAALDGIASGKSYRTIGAELWLSPQTISGIKKAVSERAYNSYRERSKKERKKRTYSTVKSSSSSRKWKGRAKRTKYGILYMP
jgi:hypothetical protein